MIYGKLQSKIIIKYNQRTGIMYKKTNNQPKPYFSHDINQKSKYMPKVQPRKSNQHHVEWIEPNNFQSETDHHFKHNQKHTNEFDIDRLDLIFKKEPKDIQQKLMKLLISYNAVMKYNKDTDMFEVDLLLPFLNQQQKKQFIKQFLQVRKKQIRELPPQKQQSSIEQQGKIKETNEQNDDLYGSKQLKKFSFNLKQYLPAQDEEMQKQQNNASFGGKEQIHYITHGSQNLGEQFDETGEFHQTNTTSNKQQHESERINLKQIDNVIAFRLKNAVSIIRKRKELQKNMFAGENISRAFNEDSSKQQESIIDQISNPSFNNTQNTSNYKQLSVSQYIKEEEQVLSREIKSQRQPYFNSRSEEQHYASLQKPYMQIEEQPFQEQDYEPLFKNNQLYNNTDNDKNKKMISFQDYTQKLVNNKTNKKKTSSINPRQTDKNPNNLNKSTRNQVLTAKQYESTKIYITQKNRANTKRQPDSSKKSTTSHNNINNRHSPISKESRKIHNQIEQFFNCHKKNLNNIYTQIKDRINKRQHTVDLHNQQEDSQRLFQKLYILVQDQTEEDENKGLKDIPEQSQSSYFRQQIMKRYHNQILVNNKNLSSQELVKYFKFLHSNAKRIYIKYLQNRNK